MGRASLAAIPANGVDVQLVARYMSASSTAASGDASVAEQGGQPLRWQGYGSPSGSPGLLQQLLLCVQKPLNHFEGFQAT